MEAYWQRRKAQALAQLRIAKRAREGPLCRPRYSLPGSGIDRRPGKQPAIGPRLRRWPADQRHPGAASLGFLFRNSLLWRNGRVHATDFPACAGGIYFDQSGDL